MRFYKTIDRFEVFKALARCCYVVIRANLQECHFCVSFWVECYEKILCVQSVPHPKHT